MVVRFPRGARRLNLPRPSSLPFWDFVLVLRALQGSACGTLVGTPIRQSSDMTWSHQLIGNVSVTYVTSLFTPSGIEGDIRNRDVP